MQEKKKPDEKPIEPKPEWPETGKTGGDIGKKGGGMGEGGIEPPAEKPKERPTV